ncbi:hypothetical protein LK10_02955 [Sinomonas humi]|uniref:Uncharacterized protein n=1 Tax=Sinomonas humi TaxID=1338436 RepID=A0A0B2ASU3_9MICC|nr:hypothetical protein LK10_02955 [Sinomonas humi]
MKTAHTTSGYWGPARSRDRRLWTGSGRPQRPRALTSGLKQPRRPRSNQSERRRRRTRAPARGPRK